jgi:nucleobase:cation symporter-1, NCS1 family
VDFDRGALVKDDTADPDPARASAPARRGILEQRAIDYIPWSERHGKVWHQGPFWFTSDFVLFTLAVGFTGPLAGLGLGWSAIAAILGSAVGTAFMAFHANQGPRLGIPQMIQSRAQFGTRGVILALVAALFTYIGFNVFDQPMATAGFQAVFGHGPIWPWYVGMVAVQAVIAVVGYDMIHRVQRWLTYVLIVVFAVLTVGAVMVFGPQKVLTLGTFNTTAFFSQFTAAAGYMIGYAIYVSDYTRYLPADTRLGPLVLWTYVGSVLASAWLMPLGALFATELKDGANVTSVMVAGNMVQPGLGSAVMLISCVALVTVMAVNTYGAKLVALTAVDSFHPIRSSVRVRVIGTVVVSAAALALALLLPERFQTIFSSFLTLILYFLVPWSAINLADFYFVRRGDYAVLEIFSPNSIYGRWAWRGLLSYAIGFLCMVPFMSLPFYTGPVARALGGVDISMLFGLSASGLVYYALARNLDLSAEHRVQLHSFAVLEPGQQAMAHRRPDGRISPLPGAVTTG